MLVALSVLNAVLIAYLFLLTMRIVLGWFAPRALGRPWDILRAITDPFLGLFSRVRFLHGAMFDFSPVAAVLILVVALDLVNQLLYWGRITLGFFLASVLSAGWMGARFILLLFLILGIIRAIPYFVRTSSGAQVWRVVDMIVKPVVDFVTRLFRFGARSGFRQHLLFTLGVLFVVWVVGEILVRSIGDLFQKLPI